MREFHEVANIFPLMQGEEFEALYQDIKSKGLIEAIWLHPDGRIIDGRNRYRACLEVGIKPRYRNWDGKGSLIDFVLSLNLRRRHLTSGQRAVLALEIEPFLTAELGIKKGGRPSEINKYNTEPEKPVEKIPPVSPKADKTKARDEAAKATGTNGRYVSDVKRMRRDAPTVFEQVKTGKISITEAKKKAFETDSPKLAQPMQVLLSHKELEYYTSSEYIETARAVMGHIDLDPASSEMANETVKAKSIFTQDDNGLDKEWAGNVWLNPPYSKTQGKSNQELWANKLIGEYQKGNVSEAILLTKAALGYKWFETLFRNWPVCLATKRLSFTKIDGTNDGQSKHGTAFFYFGNNLEKFIGEFLKWGCIIDQREGNVYPRQR